MTKRFRNLTPAQLHVFEAVAINQDGGHNPATLTKLVAVGLIVNTPRLLGYDGGVPILLSCYSVPVAVHREWCAWCAETAEVEA